MTLESHLAELVRQAVREAVREALAETQPQAELLTTDQAGELAGVTRRTIRAWAKEGLPVVRRGRRVLVRRSALLSWQRGERRDADVLLESLTKGGR